MREFVYLDEVSIFSLIASRLGPVAAEFTDTQSESLKSELQTTAGATVGVVKGEAKSRAESASTRSSQVLRKATIQATFKELYELEAENLAIRPFSSAEVPPKVKALDEIFANFGEPAFDGWVLGPGNWQRGQLMELEIELETDPIYRMSSVLTSLVDIISDSPELFPSAQAELRMPVAVNRVLERLLVGLIPIRGKATEYRVVQLRDTPLLVHTRLLDQLQEDPRSAIQDLLIVGVTEQRLYWKDIRQVLYSNSKFRVFCRVTHDDLADSWKPVKMVDVLGALTPDLPSVLNRFGSGAAKILTGRNSLSEIGEKQASYMQQALMEYAHALADHSGADLTPDILADIEEAAAIHKDSHSDHAARRAAFDAMRDIVESRAEVSIEPDPAASLRADSLSKAGLSLDGQLISEQPPIESDDSEPSVFIDAEIVAIYW